MKYHRALIAIFLVLLVSLVFAQEMKEKRVEVPIDKDGVQRLAVIGGSYYFDPSVIVVKVNVPVELLVKKAGGITPHNIVLKAPEAGIDFSVSLGSDPTSVKFTPTKVGKYPFSCTKKFLFFKSHAEHGMKGVLEVVD